MLSLVGISLISLALRAAPIDPSSLDASILANIVFEETTTESVDGQSYTIGWKKISYCDETWANANFYGLLQDDPDSVKELLPFAIAVKIIPVTTDTTEFNNNAVFTKPCSEPVFSANNNLEMSYIYSKTDLSFESRSVSSNFYGALSRVRVGCGGAGDVHPFVDDVFHGCGYASALHYKPAPEVYGRCAFASTRSGGQIEVYLGFDAGRTNVCDGTGTIGSFYSIDPCAAVTCADDGNACTDNVCVDGVCVVQNKAIGTSCSDGDKCNGNEACDGSGVCLNGIAISCDDANQCTEDICNPATGTCTNTPLPFETPCDDGDACTVDDYCDNSAQCVGLEKNCGFGEVCDGGSGECVADCDVFDIDKYEASCSSTNVDYDAAIAAIIEDIDGLRTRIGNLKIVDGDDSDSGSASIIGMDKDTLILLLLMGNMILVMILICCYMNKEDKKNVKYKQVNVYSTDEEDLKPIDGLDINA